MASEQQKAILFYVMMMTNPDLSGGNWAEISSRLGLKSDSVSTTNPSTMSAPMDKVAKIMIVYLIMTTKTALEPAGSLPLLDQMVSMPEYGDG
ncbi:hypothetical protein PG995_014083 [Apiospora arundinis]